MVPEAITLDLKSVIPLSHILLLNKSINHDDSVTIFQDGSYEGDNFHDRILYDPIHIGDCRYVKRKKVNKGGFREPPYYLDWVAMLGPI